MGDTEDQAKARAIRGFDRALKNMKVPRFGLNSQVSVGVDLPGIDVLHRNFDSELLDRANLQFRGKKDFTVRVDRTRGGVQVRFVKKF